VGSVVRRKHSLQQTFLIGGCELAESLCQCYAKRRRFFAINMSPGWQGVCITYVTASVVARAILLVIGRAGAEW
jgi:hypothetical protein